MTYYGNVNPDLLEMIPLTARHVLELGCGEGALAAAYRERNPKVRYTAIEMHEPSAVKAAELVLSKAWVAYIQHLRTPPKGMIYGYDLLRPHARPDQILLTDSGTHALDLVCRFLLQPGDTVLVDDPCYFNFLALLRAHRAKVVGVPMTPTGPDVTAFAEGLDVPEDDVRLFLALREAAHQRLFAHVPWLRAHLLESAAHMRLMVMGLILLLVLRFRPHGLIPEHSRRPRALLR